MENKLDISKELFCEVMGYKLEQVGDYFEKEVSDMDGIVYLNFYSRGSESSNQRYMSLYQFTNKCKGWAYNLGYEILEGAQTLRVYKNQKEVCSITNMCQRENFKPFDNHYALKACQWIKDNK